MPGFTSTGLIQVQIIVIDYQSMVELILPLLVKHIGVNQQQYTPCFPTYS